MNKPDIQLLQSIVLNSRFERFENQPMEGHGYVNFQFGNNSKDCKCDKNGLLHWEAFCNLKLFNSETGKEFDPENDKMLMETSVSFLFVFKPEEALRSDDAWRGYEWFFDFHARQRLAVKLRDLLKDSEFYQIPIPGV
ncbi:MAG: hypothetical protein ABFR33_04290 [Verrucomicrobiota bacterium]